MRLLYIITKYITFPGALLRCFWEQFMCKLGKVPIENNKCLQTNEMCGHIEHEMISGNVKTFFNAFIPGLMTFLLGIVCLVPALINLCFLDVSTTFLKVVCYILLYFGVSMLTNIFPGYEDALVMWESYKQLGTGLKILFAPGAVLMYYGAFLEKYSVTFWINAAIAALIIIL